MHNEPLEPNEGNINADPDALAHMITQRPKKRCQLVSGHATAYASKRTRAQAKEPRVQYETTNMCQPWSIAFLRKSADSTARKTTPGRTPRIRNNKQGNQCK